MDFFNLPIRTKVGRVIPKNAFEEYTNTKEKKLFTDCILRISWTHKLSADTVNLKANDIQEIQVFKVELKQKSSIPKILEIIHKSIPYHIVFWVEHNQEAYISTASKHQHPTNNDVAVIDWIFTTDWFKINETPYSLNLKVSLDQIFKDLCLQISGRSDLQNETLNEVIHRQEKLERLNREIAKLKSAILKNKQFNKKVELNIKLRQLESEAEILKKS